MTMSAPMFTLRASSLPELLDCPARWEAKHVRGLRLPRAATTWMGTALHRSTAAYDLALLDGDPVSAEDTAGVLVDALYRPDEDVVWTDDDPPKARAEAIGRALHTRYCHEVAPREDYLAVEVTCEGLDVAVQGCVLRFTGTAKRA